MEPCPVVSSTIPKGLDAHLAHPRTPWQMSPLLAKRAQEQPFEAGDTNFKLCQLFQEDPEAPLVFKYFNDNKPTNYYISNVYRIDNPSLTKAFEINIKHTDGRAEKFKPEWHLEDSDQEMTAARQKVIESWESQVDEFSPISVIIDDVEYTFDNARVLPLWHGTSAEIGRSIASSGFTYFGKNHCFDPNAKAGNFASTDPGYYGSGIYFTNSAKYASMYKSGCLIMAWVAMKKPFPVINDVPHSNNGNKGKDMNKLYGNGAYRGNAYQAYDAHYIPVVPTSKHSYSKEYYPCYYKDLNPECDELVVFQNVQTLPTFLIELGIELPKPLPSYASISTSSDVSSNSKFVEMLVKIDDVSRYCQGLNLEVLCVSKNCPGEKRQICKIGLGGPHDIAQVMSRRQCISCNKIVNLQKLIFWDCQFEIEGGRMGFQETQGLVAKAKDTILKVYPIHGSWSYLLIKTTRSL